MPKAICPYLITHDSEAFLNNETLAQRPQRNIYQSGNERMRRAKQTWRIAMNQLLHHLLYKKAKLIGSKADTEKAIVSVDYYQGINGHKAGRITYFVSVILLPKENKNKRLSAHIS